MPRNDVTISYRLALVTVTPLFFIWGFLTRLNDPLTPHLESIFGLTPAEAGLIPFGFFFAYLVFSLPAGRIVTRIGYPQTMVASLLSMGLGALLFVAAVGFFSPLMLLVSITFIAAGIAALQVAANPYVVAMGRAETASSRLNLAHAFSSLGICVAPFLTGLPILGIVPRSLESLHAIAADALPAYRLEEAISVIPLYLVVAAILIALGLAIAWVRLPIVPFERDLPLPGDSVWRHRSLLLGAIAVFACVGSEVSIGRSLVSYLGQPNIGNFSAEAAAKYVPLYWGSAMLGRLIGFVLLRKLPDRRLLGPSALLAAGLVTTTILSDGQVAMWSILLVGLFNAILFPSIFALSIQGLGALTGKGSGLLCAAIAGGAVIPEIHGVVADHVGVHYAFVLPVLCYLYVMFFGFKGSQRVLDNSAIMAGKELWNETSSSI